MIVQALVALLLLAQAPDAAPAPSDGTADAEAFASINAAMEPWKGKKADALRGRLGLSRSTHPAKDGEVVFWETALQSTACGVDATGRMRCGSVEGLTCRLGIAFDKQGQVTQWKALGNPAACDQFVPVIGLP